MAALRPSLQMLVARFDPSGFAAPAGEARIRLIVGEGGEYDVAAGAAPASAGP